MRAISVVIGLLSVSVSAQAGTPNRSMDIQMEVIGSFPGAQWTVPMAINNREQVVGFITSDTPVGFSAITWSRDYGFQVLLENAVATDINNRGEVTGVRYECTEFEWGRSCAPRGFVWRAQTGFTDLGDFAPNAINEAGDMAGDCVGGTSLRACALYNGTRVEWSCDLPDCGTSATGINARGEVVGNRSSPDLYDAMLFHRNGGQDVLGAGGAEDINNSGLVAGRGVQSAIAWNGGQVISASGTSVATALNARGWAVGITFQPDSAINQAFFWDPLENIVVSLDPSATGAEAIDINDRGDIVGTIHLLQEAVIWHVSQKQ